MKNIRSFLKGFFLLIARKINFHGMMRTIFYDKWYMRALKLEKILEEKGWVYVGAGKDRRVWKKGNVVLKLAFTDSGVIANNNERKIYRESIGKKQDIKYAPCRMVCEGVLMMRAVRELDYLNDANDLLLIPKWAFDLVDGQQVGIDRNGTIMVYDYADELGGINGNI